MKKPTKRELVGYYNTLCECRQHLIVSGEGTEHLVWISYSALTYWLEAPAIASAFQSTDVQSSTTNKGCQLVLLNHVVILIVEGEGTILDHAEVLLTLCSFMQEDEVFNLEDVRWNLSNISDQLFIVLTFASTVVTWVNNCTVVGTHVVEEDYVLHITLDTASCVSQEVEYIEVKAVLLGSTMNRMAIPVQHTTQFGQGRCCFRQVQHHSSFAQVKLHYQVLFK